MATGGEERWRLFVALPLSGEARAAVSELVEPLRAVYPGARWSAPTTYHLTLLFLGDLPSAGVADVRAAMRQAAGHRLPFPCRLQGAGSFGGRGRPRTAWLGLDEAAEAAAAGLALGLRTGVARSELPALAALGPVAGQAPFRAHLTVCRRADPGVPAALAARLVARSAVAWTADRIELIRSRLAADGAEHTVIALQPLGGRV